MALGWVLIWNQDGAQKCIIEKMIWQKGREGQSVETYFRMNLLAIVPHLAGDNKPGSSFGRPGGIIPDMIAWLILNV